MQIDLICLCGVIGNDAPVIINYRNTILKMSIGRFLIEFPNAKYNTVKRMGVDGGRIYIELNSHSEY